MFDDGVFVGYGLTGLASVWAEAIGQFFDAVSVSRQYVSYGNTPPTNPSDVWALAGDAQYTTLGGLPVVELYATSYYPGPRYSAATIAAPTLDFWAVPS